MSPAPEVPISSPRLAAWRARGQMYEVFGRRVFAVVAGPLEPPRSEPGSRDPERAGPSGAGGGAETLLVLHGFPTCSFDFERALPVLARRHRVVLHDHLGFGLSEKPADHGYSLFEQAELAIGLWRRLGVTRGHLVAHDYGTSVATELLARRERELLPIELGSVTLSNGSILVELARLRLSQQILRNQTLGPYLARLSSPRFFERQLRRILARPEAVSKEELEALFEGLVRDGGRERISPISRYIDERIRFRDRWFGALQRLDLPVHLLWARRDPIAVPAIPEALAAAMRHASVTWLDDLGHYPMLEDPERWASLAADWIPREGNVPPRPGSRAVASPVDPRE